MNLQQQERFYQMVTRLKANSRAASTPKDDAIVTEIVNGLIVSKPAKKIEYLSEPQKTSEPEIIDLQEYACKQVKGCFRSSKQISRDYKIPKIKR